MSEPVKKAVPQVSVKIIASAPASAPVVKAEGPTALTDNVTNASYWLNHPVHLEGLREMVNHSTILPQCIRAYKNNIAGFGIGVRYIDDIEETGEMKAEYTTAEGIIDLLNLDMDTKEVFEDLIESREIYGNAYLEVVRSIKGEVVQVEFIKDTPTIKKTSPLEPAVEAVYCYKGTKMKRRKKFCKYQQQKNGKTVYFREFGDPRIMDLRSGEYVEKGLELPYQANEILEFAIGTDDYGMVRWIGQILNVDGSRKAENLNNNYFVNGRHTPLMIVVKGGSLSDESYTKLQSYMDGIRGEAGQHAFLLLEVEDTENKAAFEDAKQPSVEIKDMASILQKDELFQDYLDNSRRKVQSSFQLPDLYVGYTTDFNRATAQTAMEVTEKQVFQPERKSLAWLINNKLLNGYRFKYVEVYFKEPDITNPDDLTKILNITERAGGLTPNAAKELTCKSLGMVSENYEEEWGDIPLVVSKAQTPAAASPSVPEQLDSAIKKAVARKDEDVMCVMKEVKKLLLKMGGEKVAM